MIVVHERAKGRRDLIRSGGDLAKPVDPAIPRQELHQSEDRDQERHESDPTKDRDRLLLVRPPGHHEEQCHQGREEQGASPGPLGVHADGTPAPRVRA